MEFGQLYRSDAVCTAGDELPPAARPEQWVGQPGTRAPHLWLTRGEERISTLDLFQHGWPLLADCETWVAAATQAAARVGITVGCQRAGVDFLPDTPDAFRSAFGLSRTGATLVRPGGYIAWRCPELPDDPTGTLAEVLARVACAAHHASGEEPATTVPA